MPLCSAFISNCHKHISMTGPVSSTAGCNFHWELHSRTVCPCSISVRVEHGGHSSSSCLILFHIKTWHLRDTWFHRGIGDNRILCLRLAVGYNTHKAAHVEMIDREFNIQEKWTLLSLLLENHAIRMSNSSIAYTSQIPSQWSPECGPLQYAVIILS